MYPYGYGYYFDPTYILIIIGVIITMIASSKMNSTFRRYSRVRCHCGLTGSQAAERILNQAGIYDVSVERVSGNLTAVSYTHLDRSYQSIYNLNGSTDLNFSIIISTTWSIL